MVVMILTKSGHILSQYDIKEFTVLATWMTSLTSQNPKPPVFWFIADYSKLLEKVSHYSTDTENTKENVWKLTQLQFHTVLSVQCWVLNYLGFFFPPTRNTFTFKNEFHASIMKSCRQTSQKSKWFRLLSLSSDYMLIILDSSLSCYY